MSLRSLFIVLLVFTGSFLFAQDTIHMISGDKVLAKIEEINPTQIKYKRFSSPDGPIYIVNKNDVYRIVFSDGHVEYFREEKEKLISAVRPLTVGINSFDLMFGFVTLNAEYYFPKRGVALKVPLSLGLRGIKGSNEVYGDDYLYYSQNKIVSAGTQILFYPGHLQQKINFFTGIAFEYGRTITYRYNGSYNYPYYPYYPSLSHVYYDWFATGVTNGASIILSDRVNLGMSATIGLAVNYMSYKVNGIGVTVTDPKPMGRLDFTLGIRLGKLTSVEKS
jgi:hypothetical protein